MKPWTLPTLGAHAAAWHSDGNGCYLCTSDGGGEPVTHLVSLSADGAVAWQREICGTEERQIAADPTGRLLATAGSRGTVDLRQTDGTLVRRLRGPERIWALAFDPSGTRLAAAASDRVLVWETAAFELLLDHSSLVPLVLWMRWSPDGDALAIGGKDGGVEILSGAGLAESHLARLHEGNVWACAWDPRGNGRIATGGWDRTVRIWDARSGEVHNTLRPAIGDGVVGLVWEPSGILVSFSSDGRVDRWDPASGAQLTRLERTPLLDVHPSPYSAAILGRTSRGFEVWDPSQPDQVPVMWALPELPRMDYAHRDSGQPRDRDLITTVRDNFRFRIPPVFGNVLAIPLDVGHSIVRAALTDGRAMRPSHPGFASAAEGVGWHGEGVMRALLELPPSRAWAIQGGLTPGIVFLPLEGDTAWFGTRGGPAPLPIEVPPPGAFVLSYGYQDLAVARRLQQDLVEAGLPTFVLDATPGQAWDAVWWLRFRTALASASHVLPLLSGDYLAREGTKLEYDEMRAMFDHRAEQVPFSPVLPVLGADAHLALSRDAAGLFGRLPAFGIATEAERARLAELCHALASARNADLAPVLSWLQSNARSVRQLRVEGRVAVDYELPTVDGGGAILRHGHDAKQVRWMPKADMAAPAELPRRRAPDTRTESEVVRAAIHGVPELVPKRIALAILEEGGDYSLFLRLGEGLDEARHSADALVVLREAWAWSGGVTRSEQRAKIEERLVRLDPLAVFASPRPLSDILQRHGGRVPSPFKLEVGTALDRAKGEFTDFTSLWKDAHRALEAGDAEAATAVIAYTYNANQSDAAQADLARLSAKIEQALGDRRTALAWLLIGLDWNPTSPRTRKDAQEALPRLMPWRGVIG